MNQKGSRRQFLKGAMGGLGGMIAARIAGLFPEAKPLLAKRTNETSPVPQPILPTQIDIGELYAGFLLLPEGAPVPDFVIYPQFGPPVICGAGQEKPELTGQGTLYSTLEGITTTVDFPIYTLTNLPSELRPRGEMSFGIQLTTSSIVYSWTKSSVICPA